MLGLRGKLPPPNALVVFEAAARLLNFTRAATELNVTQAAVSRQIRTLEEHLSAELFHRAPRGLQLTRDGHRFHQAVTMGLEHIANTAADIQRAKSGAEVTVSTSVTFANYWLIARVAKFRAAYPEIELRIVASGPVSDFTSAGVDLAIRYGSGNWAGMESTHLLDNEVFPVCSPKYLATCGPLTEPRDLLATTLLHLVEFDRNWVTWQAWMKECGVEWDPRQRGLEFDNYLILIQATLDGQGVALGGGRIAHDFLKAGALVRPIEATMRSDRAFYLLTPKDVPLNDAAILFRDWVLEEAKGTGTLEIPKA